MRKLNLCKGGSFSAVIFNSDIELSFFSFSCFVSVCLFVALLMGKDMLKICTFVCLVDMKKRSFLTSSVFWWNFIDPFIGIGYPRESHCAAVPHSNISLCQWVSMSICVLCVCSVCVWCQITMQWTLTVTQLYMSMCMLTVTLLQRYEKMA